jgi:hypothetical protein
LRKFWNSKYCGIVEAIPYKADSISFSSTTPPPKSLFIEPALLYETIDFLANALGAMF